MRNDCPRKGFGALGLFAAAVMRSRDRLAALLWYAPVCVNQRYEFIKFMHALWYG